MNLFLSFLIFFISGAWWMKQITHLVHKYHHPGFHGQ